MRSCRLAEDKSLRTWEPVPRSAPLFPCVPLELSNYSLRGHHIAILLISLENHYMTFFLSLRLFALGCLELLLATVGSHLSWPLSSLCPKLCSLLRFSAFPKAKEALGQSVVWVTSLTTQVRGGPCWTSVLGCFTNLWRRANSQRVLWRGDLSLQSVVVDFLRWGHA